MERAQPAIEALLERSLVSPDPVYRVYLERMMVANCANLAAFHASTTSSQRRHMADKLAAYGRDLQKLAAQTP
jgi:hypothetical protein